MVIQMPEQVISRKRKSLIIKKLETAAPAIRTKFGVKRIGIFGSFARGEQTRKSDIDVLIDFLPGKETYTNFMNLADFLEDLCGRKVDILSEKWVSPLLKPFISQDVIWIEI
jgi:uncharacterized protein